MLTYVWCSEYAVDLMRQGCNINLTPENGRRLQEATTGMAKMLSTDPDTCAWEDFGEF